MRPAKLRRKSKQRSRVLRFEALEDRHVLASGIGAFDPATDTFRLRNEVSAGVPTAGDFQFEAPGNIPVVGDWNGDGKDDFGVFDPSTATWSLKYDAESGPANAGVFVQGSPNSIPVVGDWNGDGRDDLGTFQPSTATWSLRLGASPGLFDAGIFQFGVANALPVVGDWDGDGRDGIGTFNRGSWRLRQTATTGTPDAGQFSFGPSTTDSIAVSGDWNGDGRDGLGVFQTGNAKWTLRQTANAGSADAGTFTYGSAGNLPVTGDFRGPALPADALATIVVPPINLDLLGVEVRTSPITVTISTDPGDGKLVGNLLNTVSSLVDLEGASDALNVVLDSTVDLLNTATLSITGAIAGPLDSAAASSAQVLELFVAPVHLDLLGLEVDTSTVRVTITTRSGEGLLLGNAVTELINLFNPPLPEDLDIDFLNQKLSELLAKLNEQLPGIAPAPVPAVPLSDGQILNVTVPPLDLNLLGLVLETSPITVNASAETGNGRLLGNVLTTALKTLDATPQNLSRLNANINGILAKVVGVLNAADLSLLAGAVDALPAALQTLVSPTLTAPADGSVTPILDLVIASPDPSQPPVDVDLLGLVVTTSNIDAHLAAQTGEGQILGNLLYNLANLADPGGPAGLLNLLDLLGAGSLDDPGEVTGGAVSPPLTTPDELMTLTVKPLEIDLLGLEIRTEPIIVTLSTQGGDGKLLGNLLNGITTLINVEGLSNALNNVLSTTVDLLNSASLLVDGVGTGTFDNATAAVVPVLDLYVAPVELDLLGLLATTEPIRLTITSRSGPGRVLGNVVNELAGLFNPPLPDRLDIDFVNERLAQLITRLNQQIPAIPPAPTPTVQLDPEQFLELTVPTLDLDLLGLLLQTSPITVNAFAHSGNGLLLGNVLTTALNTLDATTENLTGLSTNLNALLAKVVGVLNAADLVLPSGLLGALPSVLQTLASPTLIGTEPGATAPILDLIISSGDNSGPPVDVDLLGLSVSTSNIEARLLGQTGDGNLLGNLLYNIANLLNPRGSSTLLAILSQLGRVRLDAEGTVSYSENAAPVVLASDAALALNSSTTFESGKLTVTIAGNMNVNDRLLIRNQGTGAGQIGRNNRDVTFGGVKFATFSGGAADIPLVVTFDANATAAAVEALVRNITFLTLGDAPSTALRSITFRLTDGNNGASNPASKSVRVIPVNDSPVLNIAGSPVLAAIAEDTTNSPGTLIKTFAAHAISDPDANAKKGIAVVAADGSHGRWQYTLNGTTWQNVGSVSAYSALLLPADDVARLRFIPNANFNGQVAITYRAWDQTQLAAGSRITTNGTVGGTKSLSIAVETATLRVLAVNDAPTLALGGTLEYTRNDPAIVLAPSALLSDIDSPNFDTGRLRVRIGGGAASSNFLQLGGSFTVDLDDNVKYGTTVIGKRTSSGIGTNDLIITFNANATPAIAELLVRSISFGTTDGTTETRSVLFSLTDGDGAGSVEQSVTVNVN